MKEAFCFLKFSYIIKSDIWAEIDHVFLKHFDKIGIGPLTIRISIEQKGGLTVLLFHGFGRGLLYGFVNINIFSCSTLRLLDYFRFGLIFFEVKFWWIPDIRIFVDDFFGHHVIIGFGGVHAVISGGGSEIGFGLVKVFTAIKLFRGIEGERVCMIDKAVVVGESCNHTSEALYNIFFLNDL